ncbi:NHLP bacteriocin export ABC transporter permease/ATPase subunit [Spongiactinospora sp. TRM90649]|uniref:NHLP bacteriocin export ABC transporter permease/ATPase subunit n=1 Tax=Spongiactinospora sp. TRM90649 TaxID=3031114 RepID=UPI0023F72CF8|nr:NHLP bacteriocin export ABC transporter permease/ATPase subunit [Spongiactinospora sp. TRM90649]MDF5757703.1 NHLP bacteriocin export ABC transporter permease/ATPase subunit [Spongiactinospora sp. TRM90649]
MDGEPSRRTRQLRVSPPPPGPHGRDGLLAEFGEELGVGEARHVMLGGEHSVWVIEGAPADLFAVDPVERGAWHFVGRVTADTVIPGSARRTRHALVLRTEPGCRVRQVPLWPLGQARNQESLRERHEALSRALDHGITLLHDCVRQAFPGDDPAAFGGVREVHLPAGDVGVLGDGVAWAVIDSGRVMPTGIGGHAERVAGEVIALTKGDRIAAVADADLVLRRTGELVAKGMVWEILIRHHTDAMVALDRWIDDKRRVDGDRLQAGRQASEGAMRQAVSVLADAARASHARPPAGGDGGVGVGGVGGVAASAGDVDAALAVCRLVCRAVGITDVRLPHGPADGRVDAVTRIATASRVRTRPVRLAGAWWLNEAGPLLAHRAGDRTPVALLWRRGGYDIVDPDGTRRRATETTARDLSPEAVMFYRSLPPERVGGLRLLGFGLRGAGADLARLLITGLAAFGLGLGVPILSGRIIGEYVPAARTDLLVQACLALVMAGVVMTAFAVVNAVAVVRLEGRLDATIQAAVWDRLLRLPMTFFRRYSTGELANAALGINAIRAQLTGIATVVLNAVLLGVVNLALLIAYSPSLGLLAVSVVLVHGTAFAYIAVRRLRWQRELVEVEYRLSDQVFHTLRGLPKLRVAGAETYAYARWAFTFAESRALYRRLQRGQSAITLINTVTVPIGTFLLFLLLAGPAMGTLSLSGFVTFLMAFTTLLAAATQLVTAVSSVGQVVPMFEKVRPLLTEPPEVAEASVAPETLTGDIELSGVSLRYADDGPLVLDDISLKIGAGEFVAIVGPTGCGKSSVLRLLIGFERPTTGTVRYDGADLGRLDLLEVRRQCGVVLQHAQPFAGTVFSNICGAEPYTMDEAWAAARAAGLAQDIERMPMGMRTPVADGAPGLSGGQRQRLMIARALIRQPKILFFDEATSALDNEAQAVVTESTGRLRATRVVVAHRLSTVIRADRVIVMSGGRIVQSGTPAELMAQRDGLFYRLARSQAV